ncbi:MAG: hypothetical protein MR727_13120 [Lentisphaeria bacterium]|nr:hypothetical protein [Lentisphaeria bacterium]
MKLRNILPGLFLLFSTAAAAQERFPLLRFEAASVPQVSSSLSRLGDCIAPKFKDSLAAATVVLTMGAAQYGMDLTRPLIIEIYGLGKTPSMRIFAHALPSKEDMRSSAKLWNARFSVRRTGNMILFFTEDLRSCPVPAFPPGSALQSGELLRAEADPEILRIMNLPAGKRKPSENSTRLLLRGTEELAAAVKHVRLSFSAEPETLHLTLRAEAKPGSALADWMRRPLPPKESIKTFEGASTLTVLRLPPTDALRHYGRNYLRLNGRDVLPPEWTMSVSGFAVLAARHSGSPAARLCLGIVPEYFPALRQGMEKLGYTPFPGLWQLRRTPPLFCSAGKNALILYGLERVERETLEQMRSPQPLNLPVPDCPFVCLDLAHPEKPLVQLTFERNELVFRFQAPDSWFASFRPLLEKPLHKLILQKNNLKD